MGDVCVVQWERGARELGRIGRDKEVGGVNCELEGERREESEIWGREELMYSEAGIDSAVWHYHEIAISLCAIGLAGKRPAF